MLKKFKPTTVIVSAEVSELPSLFVTVKVYVVVVEGLTVTGVSEVTVPTLLSILPVPSAIKTAVKSTLFPVVIVVDEAVKLVMVGVVVVVEEGVFPPLLHALIIININSNDIMLIKNFMRKISNQLAHSATIADV